MSSLMNAIRRATGGAGKPRLEDERPEDTDEDVAAEDGADDADAEDDEDPAKDDADAEDGDGETDPEAEDDEEDKKMSAAEKRVFARGRRAERKRIGAILGSKAAQANQALAAHLTFATSDSASKAVAALKAAGPAATASGGLSSRMNARHPSRLGTGGEQASGKDPGASWGRALGKAGVARKAK